MAKKNCGCKKDKPTALYAVLDSAGILSSRLYRQREINKALLDLGEGYKSIKFNLYSPGYQAALDPEQEPEAVAPPPSEAQG